jgi:hypothetical protein
VRRKKMLKQGMCPHCNIKMKCENGENGEVTEYWWECTCGRSYDVDNGKDITDYECTNIVEVLPKEGK